MVTESGEIELGAELKVDQGEIESTNESAAMDTNADVDNTCNA